MTTNRAHVLLWTDNTAPYLDGIKAAGLADRVAVETLSRKDKPSSDQLANTEVLMATLRRASNCASSRPLAKERRRGSWTTAKAPLLSPP